MHAAMLSKDTRRAISFAAKPTALINGTECAKLLKEAAFGTHMPTALTCISDCKPAQCVIYVHVHPSIIQHNVWSEGHQDVRQHLQNSSTPQQQQQQQQQQHQFSHHPSII
jgi:hypothetical protein